MEPLEFELYENLSDEGTLRQGELKSYATKEDGSMIYERTKSDHSVTVERLLWIDGYEQSVGVGEAAVHNQEMTLIVLKIVVASHDPDMRFRHVAATITFEDPSKQGTGNEPEVEAWAPFRDEKRWNATTADIKKTTRMEGNVTLGYNSSQISGARSQEGEISWTQQDFDVGRSSAIPSKRTNKRNGVTWTVEQNVQQAKGVTPEIWTAVLLSRRTKSPYLVNFQIDVRAGTMEEFFNKTRRIFGTHPGMTKAFPVTPWQRDVCNYEGHDIIKCVDRNNLGTLRHKDKRTDLNVRWGPKYQTKTNPACTSPDMEMEATPLISGKDVSEQDPNQGTSSDEQIDSNTAGGKGAPMPSFPSVSASTGAVPPASHLSNIPSLLQTSGLSPAAASQAPAPAGIPSAPPLLIGWYQAPTPLLQPNLDTGRLTALETRTAQIEARLATQDAIISQLREELSKKTAQVARLEKIIADS